MKVRSSPFFPCLLSIAFPDFGLVGQSKKKSLEKLEKSQNSTPGTTPSIDHCCGAWKKLGNNKTILNTKSIWWKNHLVDVINTT